jgi:Bacteriophage clamp loader A subunit
MASPFDYIGSFSSKKENLWDELTATKDYNSWVINRGMSFMHDTIFYANMMNRYSMDLDRKPQHDFYYNVVPKGKRFGKWIKPLEVTPDIQLLSDYFCINNRVAEKDLELLTSDQLQIIRDKMSKGGKHGRRG